MNRQEQKEAKDAKSAYNHVLKFTGLFGGVQVLTMLMSLIRNKVASEQLGPSGLALVSLFNNIIRLSYQTTNLGISFSAVKSIAELSEETDTAKQAEAVATVRVWSVLTGLVGMLILLMLSNVVSRLTFDSAEYSWAVAALSPIVLMLALQTGEIAIMKGLKILKSVALVSAIGSIFVLAICIPMYCIWGVNGIIPALIGSNLAYMSFTLYMGNRAMPWKVSFFSKDLYVKGLPIIKLGVGYIIAGIFCEGAEYIIRNSIVHYGDYADMGLYNSGYTLAVTYASMIFVAVEADFFPRLSSANSNIAKSNTIINQQIEVCLLLVAPTLITFVIAMPYLLPLLFASKFTNAVPMAICAMGFTFFKALTLPIAYLPLAKGDSKTFMIAELIYDAFVAIAVPQAYKLWGLEGTGWALTAAGVFDFIIILVGYSMLYGFRFDCSKIKIYATQGVLLAVAIALSFLDNLYVKWGAGMAVLAISAYITWRILRQKTDVIERIKQKFMKKKNSTTPSQEGENG